MYYVCKGCDDCCRSCCHCCEECCGDCCDAIAKCFSTPFSFCAFITFFVSVVPFIIMLVALAQSKDYDCEGNLKTVMIIQGVNNLLNFIFCIYLTCQYGVRGKRIENEMELSFLEKTANLILYDWVVCLYILALIFFFVWMIVGFNTVSNESPTSLCRTENNGIVITATLINLWMLVIYLIAGLIIFLWTVVLYACDDGGCSCGTMGRCCCFVITCGACDLQQDRQEKQTKEQRIRQSQQVKEKYDDNRKGWITSSKRMFGFLGIGQSQQLQQNQNINNMNNNNMNNDYRQPQPQPQPQPQKPAKSFWSFLDIFKSDNPPPQTNQQPQYQAPTQHQYQAPTQPQYTQQNLFIQPQQPYQHPQYQQPPQQFQQQQQPYYYQQPQQPQNGWGR